MDKNNRHRRGLGYEKKLMRKSGIQTRWYTEGERDIFLYKRGRAVKRQRGDGMRKKGHRKGKKEDT